MVMLVHTTFACFGWDTTIIGIQLLAGFTIIGVNVFVFITGYFSANLKKTSLINLAFICLFWMIIKVICRYYFNQPVGIKNVFFITSSNWFIPCYIGLLFFSPILNVFCNSVNKKALRNAVVALLFIEIWFDWFPPIPALTIGTQGGCSVLSFVILYLLARYIKLYGIPNWFKKASFLIYVLCSVFLVLMNYLFLRLGHPKPKMVFTYSNPIVIISSIAFFMMFEQMRIQSSIINHIAKSTLAVLLGHTAIFFLYTKQFKYLYTNFSGIQVVVYWALAIIIVFCASIVIDQLRLFLYKPLEKLMKRRIDNNNIVELPNSNS